MSSKDKYSTHAARDYVLIKLTPQDSQEPSFPSVLCCKRLPNDATILAESKCCSAEFSASASANHGWPHLPWLKKRLRARRVCMFMPGMLIPKGEKADQTRRTSTRSFSHIGLGILTDAPAFSSFRTSMNVKYSTPGSANPVAVFITSTTAGTRTVFATGYCGYEPLTSEGFAIYTSVFPVTSCTPLTPTTPTLPPSPTGSICSAHGDHCKS